MIKTPLSTMIGGAFWTPKATILDTILDGEKPIIVSIDVSSDGLSVAITFSEAIQKGTLNLTLNVASVTRTYASSVSGSVLTLIPSSVIYQGETVSIAYISGITDLSGNEADANTANATNNSTVVKPVVDPILAVLNRSGVQGLYYDINDLSTLYQDSSGTIPVTSVGQTVARINAVNSTNNPLIQTTASRCMKLALNAATGFYYLISDGVDDCYTQDTYIINPSRYLTVFALAQFNSSKQQQFLANYLSLAEDGYVQYVRFLDADGVHKNISPYIPSYPQKSLSYFLRDSVGTLSTSRFNKGGNISHTHVSGLEYTEINLSVSNRSSVNCMNGHIYAMVALNTQCTTTEITEIENFLSQRLGL